MARAIRVKAKPREFRKDIMDAAEVIDWNKKNPGKPALYHEKFCHLVEVLTLVGGILNDVANLLGTREDTISGWMTAHPQFGMAIKRARANADAQVEKALFKRAMGYSHPAVKIFNDEGTPLIVKYTEQYAPDTGALAFWLKNRKPEEWREKQDENKNMTADEMKRLLREELSALDGANLEA